MFYGVRHPDRFHSRWVSPCDHRGHHVHFGGDRHHGHVHFGGDRWVGQE